jgi:hypothetical protein
LASWRGAIRFETSLSVALRLGLTTARQRSECVIEQMAHLKPDL